MSSYRYSRTLFAVALAAAVGVAQAPARADGATEADKKAARPHYEKGATEYNLGHFGDAIAEFEKAYQLDRAPILLFNIAQAHRQNGNIERAAFFYRRYLEQAPTAANRPEVERRIKDLEEALNQQNDLKRRPPTEVANDDRELPRTQQQADATAPVVAPPPPPPPGGGDVSTVRQQPPPPPREDNHVRVSVAAGPAFPMFSGRDIDSTTMLSLRAAGYYTLDVAPKLAVDLGLSLGYAPLAYHTDANVEQTTGFWGVMATGVGRYRVAPALDLKGELGLGMVWWSGLAEMNPFTANGAGASAPVAMPSLLLGVGADYEVARSIYVFLEPNLVVSKTVGDGFTSAVSSVLRFDLAIGLGYKI